MEWPFEVRYGSGYSKDASVGLVAIYKKQSLRIEWRRWNYQRQGGSGDVSMFEVYSMDAIRNNLYVETTNKHDEASKKDKQDSVKCIMKNLWIHFWKSQKCLLSSTNVDLRISQ